MKVINIIIVVVVVVVVVVIKIKNLGMPHFGKERIFNETR